MALDVYALCSFCYWPDHRSFEVGVLDTIAAEGAVDQLNGTLDPLCVRLATPLLLASAHMCGN